MQVLLVGLQRSYDRCTDQFVCLIPFCFLKSNELLMPSLGEKLLIPTIAALEAKAQ